MYEKLYDVGDQYKSQCTDTGHQELKSQILLSPKGLLQLKSIFTVYEN